MTSKSKIRKKMFWVGYHHGFHEGVRLVMRVIAGSAFGAILIAAVFKYWL